MEKCAICGADTILMVSGRPLCVQCDDRLERQAQAPPDNRANRNQTQASDASVPDCQE